MATKAQLQHENDELRQRVAQLEKQLAACREETDAERLHNLFEHVPVAYQSLDEQGRFVDVNSAYCQLVGYHAADLLGRIFGDLWTPASRAALLPAFEGLKRDNAVQADLQLVRNDGAVLEVVLNGSVQRDEQGRFIRTHCFLYDVTEHKQAEVQRARLAAERDRYAERLQLILDQMPIACIMNDPDFNVVYWNRAAEAIFGFSAAEMLGQPPYGTFIAEEARAYVEDLRQQMAVHGVPTAGFNQNRTKDGRLILCEWHNTPLRDEAGQLTGFLAMAQDVTERKQAEEKLQQQTEKLQILYKASRRLSSTLDLHEIYQIVSDFMAEIAPNDGLIISNFEAHSRMITCRAYRMNNEWLAVGEFPPIPLEDKGKGTQSMVIHSGKALLLNDYEAAMRTARTSYYFNDASGTVEPTEDYAIEPEEEVTRSALVVPLKVGGLVTGVVQVFSFRRDAYTDDQLQLLEALAVNISSAEQNARLYAQAQAELEERKRAEQQLRANEQELQAIFDMLPVGVSLTDQQRRVLKTNAELEKILGLSHDQLVRGDYGNRRYVRDDGTDMPFNELPSVRAVQAGETMHNVPIGVVKEDGETLWTSVSVAPLSKGGVVMVTNDITEHRQAEEKLRESEEKYRTLVDAMADGVFVAQGERFIYANLALPARLGYTLAEFEGLPFEQVVAPEHLGVWIERYRQRIAGQAPLANYETQFMNKAWTEKIWFELRANEIVYGGKPAVLGIIHDITERKQAEEKLRQSEERYRQAIIAADAIPYALDYATNQYTFVGEGLEKLTGIPADEISIEKFMPLIIDSVVQGDLKGLEFMPALQLTRAGQGGQFWKCDHHIRTRDGHERWLSDSSIQIVDEGGKPTGAIGIIQDITEHKASEKVLQDRIQQATAEIQDLYDHAPTGYHSLDAAGRIVMINQTELDWLGYTRAELIGRPIAELLTDSARALMALEFPRLITDGRAADFEVQIICKDGSIRDVLLNATAIYDPQGNFRQTRSTLVDITARKRVEEALKASEAKYRLLFENMTEGFALHEIITDDNGHPVDYRVLEANGAYERHTGVPPQGVIGQATLALFPQIDPHLIQIYSQVALSGQPIAFEEFSKPLNRYLSVRAFSTRRGQFATIFEDITERKAAEHAVQLSRDQLDLANRELARASRAKDEFLANMSHELRTPLNSILGLAQSLSEQYIGPLNARQLEAVTIVEASGRHLLALINDILDLSKIESGHITLDLAPVSAPTVCQASLQFIKHIAHQKNIQVSSRFDEAVTRIQADERRLKQMLVNLLNNAVKFTPEGGQVELIVTGDRAQHRVQFSVRDTGIGIAPNDLPRLFKPFVQLDSGLTRQYEGTGLGLSIVQRLAELHGGSVTVDSTPGQGSVFTISLPWAETVPTLSEAAAPAAATLPAASDGERAPLILIAEDNEANVLTVSTYLEALGFRLAVARNGGDMLAKVQAEPPALILMDLQMPVLDGLEATRRLRRVADRRIAGIPIIALTALVTPTDRERALAAGATAYVTKPIDLRQLAELIQRLLKEH